MAISDPGCLCSSSSSSSLTGGLYLSASFLWKPLFARLHVYLLFARLHVYLFSVLLLRPPAPPPPPPPGQGMVTVTVTVTGGNTKQRTLCYFVNGCFRVHLATLDDGNDFGWTIDFVYHVVKSLSRSLSLSYISLQKSNFLFLMRILITS
jgi:hypothetical protein